MKPSSDEFLMNLMKFEIHHQIRQGDEFDCLITNPYLIDKFIKFIKP